MLVGGTTPKDLVGVLGRPPLIMAATESPEPPVGVLGPDGEGTRPLGLAESGGAEIGPCPPTVGVLVLLLVSTGGFTSSDSSSSSSDPPGKESVGRGG